MKTLRHFLVAAYALVLAPGCKYRGAVYSEYTTAGVDIRANAASESPIQVSFGYDRGVAALIPRRTSGTNGSPGEAVSAISWSNLGSRYSPAASNTVLAVDAGFITGTAATVIAAPTNATVIIQGAAGITNAVVTVDGSAAGERIASAMAVEGNYSADASTARLRRFWKPDGAAINADNENAIKQFLRDNQLGSLPISALLYLDQYKSLREAAARSLGLFP